MFLNKIKQANQWTIISVQFFKIFNDLFVLKCYNWQQKCKLPINTFITDIPVDLKDSDDEHSDVITDGKQPSVTNSDAPQNSTQAMLSPLLMLPSTSSGPNPSVNLGKKRKGIVQCTLVSH